ncbi:MAG TPA: NUDIX domain-containing protein [Geobacterales bacterium]|nr:NUDIX domain-containing protein [Geobacterales bacterium]
MKIENSAGAIIFKIIDNKPYYLLLKARYKSEYWEFPKGLIESNENTEEAALREIREETGLNKIEFIPGFKEKISYYYKRDNDLIHKTVVFYLAEFKDEEIKISSEHIEYSWLSYEEARKRLKKNMAELLDKVHKFINEKLIHKESMLNFFSAPSGI